MDREMKFRFSAVRFLIVGIAIVAAIGAQAFQDTARQNPAPAGNEVENSEILIRCDGRTDDSPTINAALDGIRKRPTPIPQAWPVGHAGRLKIATTKCLIKSTINMTHLYGSGFVADLWGTQIFCQTDGKPCIDATGSGQFSLLGLNLIGDCNGGTPNIGLVLARKTESLAAGADHVYLDHPTIAGCFTLSDFYNRSSETTHITAAAFYNYRGHAHAAIWDGSNVFGFQSEFYAERYTDGKYSSFNENTCDTCLFETFGHGATPLWIGGAVRHKFVNGYVLGQQADGAPALVLSFANSMPNDFLDLNIHFENRSLGSLILITGAARPVIHSLHLNDPMPFQSGPIFKRDGANDNVTIEDADFHIGKLAGTNPGWWDAAEHYVIAGSLYARDRAFTYPRRFTGALCLSDSCTYKN